MEGTITVTKDSLIIKSTVRTIKFVKVKDNFINVQIHKNADDDNKGVKEYVAGFGLGETSINLVKRFFNDVSGEIL